MRSLKAVSLSIIIHSLIFNARSASTSTHSKDVLDRRSIRDHHRKPPSSNGRIKAGEEFNNGIHLELAPSCGVLSANSWIGEINAGIAWHKMETVVSFGDGYSQVGNGGDGSLLAPREEPQRRPGRNHPLSQKHSLDRRSVLRNGYWSFQWSYWDGLRDLHHDTKSTGGDKTVNFAFVDNSHFFSAIRENYPKVGYTSSKYGLEGQRASIEDECEDPERTVYYMGAHPSRQTHHILTEYVASALTRCWTAGDKRPHGSLSHHGSALCYQLHGYLPFSTTSVILAFLILLCAYRPIISRRGGFSGAQSPPIVANRPR